MKAQALILFVTMASCKTGSISANLESSKQQASCLIENPLNYQESWALWYDTISNAQLTGVRIQQRHTGEGVLVNLGAMPALSSEVIDSWRRGGVRTPFNAELMLDSKEWRCYGRDPGPPAVPDKLVCIQTRNNTKPNSVHAYLITRESRKSSENVATAYSSVCKSPRIVL
jgi:hypothetical protein